MSAPENLIKEDNKFNTKIFINKLKRKQNGKNKKREH